MLVGEYMGWNFAVGKGGMFGALIALLVVGILYTCVAMIDSEVTSTVAAAGGQYTQAKHMIGPLMAFNVGLFLVLEYTMLEAADANVMSYLATTVAGHLGYTGNVNQYAFIVLAIMVLAFLNYRGVLATLSVNFVITGVAFVAIIVLFFGMEGLTPGAQMHFNGLASSYRQRAALRMARRVRGPAVRHVVLPRHRGDLPGGGGVPLGGALDPARDDDRHHHAAHRRDHHVVRLRRARCPGSTSGSRSPRCSTPRS